MFVNPDITLASCGVNSVLPSWENSKHSSASDQRRNNAYRIRLPKDFSWRRTFIANVTQITFPRQILNLEFSEFTISMSLIKNVLSHLRQWKSFEHNFALGDFSWHDQLKQAINVTHLIVDFFPNWNEISNISFKLCMKTHLCADARDPSLEVSFPSSPLTIATAAPT